jgi:hypothetical protein
MRRTALTLAGLTAAVIAQSSWVPQKALALAQELIVPQPIASGDFFPAIPPHHQAGIIHQWFPTDANGGDGFLAEPNGITDFNGFIAQVFMGGRAVDSHGNQYIVDVDNRVYQGEYIGTNGEHASATFCEI